MQLIAERDDGIRIVRVLTSQGGETWRAAFAGAYQAVWSEPPYSERFFPDEAEGVLRKAIRIPENITLLATTPNGLVAGFAIAYPVVGRPDVVREIRGLLPVEETFYFAELGVLEKWRHHGLGHQLVELRLQLIDTTRFHHVLLRTSAVRNQSYEMYVKMGFVDTGVYMEVPARRQDGGVRTDRRLFMAKVL